MISGFGGASENHDDDGLEFGSLAHPGKDFKAMNVGKFQVQKNEERQRETAAIRKLACARKVIEGLLAVSHDLERLGYSGAFESALCDKNVIVIIFDEENRERVHAESSGSFI